MDHCFSWRFTGSCRRRSLRKSSAVGWRSKPARIAACATNGVSEFQGGLSKDDDEQAEFVEWVKRAPRETTTVSAEAYDELLRMPACPAQANEKLIAAMRRGSVFDTDKLGSK